MLPDTACRDAACVPTDSVGKLPQCVMDIMHATGCTDVGRITSVLHKCGGHELHCIRQLQGGPQALVSCRCLGSEHDSVYACVGSAVVVSASGFVLDAAAAVHGAFDGMTHSAVPVMKTESW